MTKDNIKELAEALNSKARRKDTKQRIQKVFRNKKSSTIIRELKTLMPQMSQKEQKVSLLIVVMSILYKNGGLINDVKTALEEENLIPHLYGALCIYLSGKSSTMHLEVKWGDSSFPNKFEFLRRFSYNFGYWENREVLYAAKIIALTDRNRFEELAFKDATRLIILNMISYELEESPTDKLIIRLLMEGDELQANIGFYFAVRDIMRDMQDYQLLEKNPELPGIKSKRAINKNVRRHLERFYMFYSHCSPERKISLLLNYILSEKIYPNWFGYLLMEVEIQEALIQEITLSGKIRTLDHLTSVVFLANDFPCKDTNGKSYEKKKVYEAILSVLENFITNRNGIYLWDDRKKHLFELICKKLPKKYLRKFNAFLKKNIKTYMISELDEMVRFNIYLEDKKQWDICQGMMNVLKDLGIE